MMRFRNLSVGRQLMVLIMVTSTVAVGLAMLGFGSFEYRFLKQRIQTNMQTLATLIGQNSSAALLFQDVRDAEQTLNSLQAENHVLGAALYLPNGRRMASYQRSELSPTHPPLPETAPFERPQSTSKYQVIFDPILLDGERVGYILIRHDLRDLTQQAMLMTAIGGAVLTLSLLLSSLLALWLQRVISSPIRDMADTAQQVADEGDYSLRVQPSLGNEINSLAQSFNRMLEEILNRDQKLVESNQLLEKRVKDRTLDLETEMDIRRGVQFELQRRNEIFHNIISRNSEGVMVIAEDCIRFSNPAAARFLGSDVASLLNEPVPFPIPRKETKIVELTLASRTPTQFALRIIPTEWNAAPAELILMQDISKAQQLQDQLNQAQKSEIIGQFAGGVAHDFNNILFVIGGTGTLLREHLPLDNQPKLKNLLEDMLRATEKGAELTRQLLVFSRHQVYEANTINVTDTLQGMMKILRRLIREDMELVTLLPDKNLYVYGGAVQLQQVIMNLVVNARDAMGEEGGRCEVQIKEIDRKHSKLPPWVCLSVQDNGTGIPEAIRDKIFEPFFTTKEKGQGTGLGLATVKAIVERMDGRIELESHAGEGTCFRILLPQEFPTEEELNPALLKTPQRKYKAAQLHILLVDDDPMVNETLSILLSMSGYKVESKMLASEALRHCEEHGPPDMLISDMVMPEMTGAELAQELRLRFPDLPVLLMSGYNEDLVLGTVLKTARTAYIQKPFSMDNLNQAVHDLMHPTLSPPSAP